MKSNMEDIKRAFKRGMGRQPTMSELSKVWFAYGDWKDCICKPKSRRGVCVVCGGANKSIVPRKITLTKES